MCEFDAVLAEHPDAKFGDDGAPVEHGFGDGLYIRKITMPAGLLVSSEIHETTHPYFVLAGQALVKTEVGWRIIRAPYHGMTKAGTKRILYIIEDCVWITVHASKTKDIQKIRRKILGRPGKYMNAELREELRRALKCHGFLLR
jgi:hypothetical protein